MGIFSGIFGSGNSGKSSSQSKQKSKTNTYYTPLDAGAMDTLKSLAAKSGGMANAASPYASGLIDANMALLPEAQGASWDVLQQIANEAQASTPVASKFYQEAMEGVDPLQRANEAETEVVSAFDKAREAEMRNLGRYGISPQNVEKDERMRAIEEAKAIAGARTGAENQAEQESWAKLVNAMQGRGQGLSSLSDTTNLFNTGEAMSGALQALGLSGNLTTPGLTAKKVTSSTRGKTFGNARNTSTQTPSLWDIGKTLAGGTLGFMMGGPAGAAVGANMAGGLANSAGGLGLGDYSIG